MTKEEIINEVMRDWATDFLRELESTAKSKLPTDTGEGQTSFDASVKDAVTQGASTVAQVMVGFREYMRYFDMINYSRSNYLDPHGLERMKDWVRRNLSKLLTGYQGQIYYKKRPGMIPEKRLINNIAWGISTIKGRTKRKQWYAKLKGSHQYQLYFKMLDELMPVMLEEVKGKVLK